MFTAHLKNPPSNIYAFVYRRVKDQVMGMAVTEKGIPIEAVILPTRQRVMLALGVGDDKSNIHHKYRRLHPNGYELIWVRDSKTDPRLARFRGESEDTPGHEAEIHSGRESIPDERAGTPPESSREPIDPTVALMQAGMERGRPSKSDARIPNKPDLQPQIDENNTGGREHTQSKPEKAADFFGEV